MKLRLYAAPSAMMAAVLLTASFSYADKDWDQYLGLSRSQHVQLRMDNQTRKGTVDPAKQDRDAATQSLVTQVLANAGDPAVQPILSQILGDIKTIDGAEENYWQSLMGSLNPIQVAKIYLKDHPPKNPPAVPPAPANPIPNSGKGFDWNAYFELSTDQATQLKAADQAKNAQMKPTKEEKEAAIEQLNQLVQSNAAGIAIQPTLRTLLTDDQTEHQVEQAFWGTTLPGFLTPTQTAKLYLHRRTPKGAFTPPPPGGTSK